MVIEASPVEVFNGRVDEGYLSEKDNAYSMNDCLNHLSQCKQSDACFIAYDDSSKKCYKRVSFPVQILKWSPNVLVNVNSKWKLLYKNDNKEYLTKKPVVLWLLDQVSRPSCGMSYLLAYYSCSFVRLSVFLSFSL